MLERLSRPAEIGTTGVIFATKSACMSEQRNIPLDEAKAIGGLISDQWL